MDRIAELAGRLGGRRFDHYGPAPLPDPRDEAPRRFVDALGDESQVRSAVPHLDADRAGTLAAFAERMASLAVRRQDRRALQAGLIAAALALPHNDPRDTLPALSLLYRAAEMIVGADPVTEFETAARRVGDPLAGPLRGFLSRNAEDRSIAAMAYTEGDDRDGFRFVRTW